MGDWKPDHYVRIEHSKLYKWVVPTRVAGPWEWEGAAGEPYLIELEQEFQEVTGRAWIAGKRVVLKEAVVAGPRLELQLVPGNTEEMETWILDFTDDEDEPTVTLKEP